MITSTAGLSFRKTTNKLRKTSIDLLPQKYFPTFTTLINTSER